MLQENNKQWYKGWFDSPYYHLLYKNRDVSEAELFIDNIVTCLHPNEDARFLDLACGKGRHAIYLNKKGYDVTGVDLSAQSIDFAKQFEKDNLQFYVHDMRQPCRVNYFDGVFNLFSSFGYFDAERENYAVVNAMAQSLKSKGVLVIDFFNKIKVIENMVSKEEKVVDGIVFNIKRKLQDGFIIKQIAFSDKGCDYFFEERVRALSVSDFEKYLEANKLKILNLFGDYQLNAFNPQVSDRLILIAQKQ